MIRFVINIIYDLILVMNLINLTSFSCNFLMILNSV